jgi:hypothetical protein
MQQRMKPTRKISPRSFVSQVSGGQRGGAFTKLAGESREHSPENDHDAPHPAQGGGAPNDHDS